jgi:hypothetical protein
VHEYADRDARDSRTFFTENLAHGVIIDAFGGPACKPSLREISDNGAYQEQSVRSTVDS